MVLHTNFLSSLRIVSAFLPVDLLQRLYDIVCISLNLLNSVGHELLSAVSVHDVVSDQPNCTDDISECFISQTSQTPNNISIALFGPTPN